MRRNLYALIVLLFVFSFNDITASDKAKFNDGINVEQLSDKPHQYSVCLKFDSIESVTVGTTIIAESLGIKHESYSLQKSEWSYNSENNLLHLDREIDSSKYIVSVTGKYRIPLSVVPVEKIDSAKIRFIVDGRIGIPDKDFRYDQIKNEIELLSCTTGKENYILQYRLSQGSASIGSMSTSLLTRSLLEYLEWPTDGNTIPLDRSGLRFSPQEKKYKSVWMVQFLPVGYGYTGKDQLSGFYWDTVKNELILDEPVDTEKYSVMILGEEI